MQGSTRAHDDDGIEHTANGVAPTVKFTAEDIAERHDNARTATVDDVWFVIHTGDDFNGVVSSVVSDPDVELYKADRSEGKVSAAHHAFVDELADN
jgi:hypothetical protein